MKQTAIEWAHSTFNPWWGCQKVSPACVHCYAEAVAHRFGHDVWGPEKPRRFFAQAHWDQPLKWNRQAQQEGRPWRVFCGSMCDVLEDREDLVAQRVRLWELIERTPHLTWLLLTKRPERFQEATPNRWWSHDTWPQHVWVGTTVENQEWADRRIPYLLEVPARVRFLSCEPLLSPLDLSPWLWKSGCEPHCGDRCSRDIDCPFEWTNAIQWVIAGGESGTEARPTSPDWARSLRDQCQASGIPFFWKQWGEWTPISTTDGRQLLPIGDYHVASRYGFSRMARIGRLLDGREWNDIPEQA